MREKNQKSEVREQKKHRQEARRVVRPETTVRVVIPSRGVALGAGEAGMNVTHVILCGVGERVGSEVARIQSMDPNFIATGDPSSLRSSG